MSEDVVGVRLEVKGRTVFTGELDKATGAIKKIHDEAKKVDSATGSSFLSTAINRIGGLQNVAQRSASAISGLLKPMALLVGGVGGVGLGALATYGFKSAEAVQASASGIKALTDNTADANKVVAQMIQYVQGKPFDRLDTIQAARNMLAFGDSVGDIEGDINRIGKAVLLTNGNWGDLTQIFGQITSSGRLTLTQFDELTQRGIPLGKALGKYLGIDSNEVRDKLMGHAVSLKGFRAAMDNALPEALITEQSQTIQNKLLTLKTSFRNLAGEALGINWDKAAGADFIRPGGPMDLILKTVDKLIVRLKSPEMKEAFRKMGDDLAKIADTWLPRILTAFEWLMTHLPLVVNITLGLAGAFLAVKTASAALEGVRLAMLGINGAIQLATWSMGLFTAAEKTADAAGGAHFAPGAAKGASTASKVGKVGKLAVGVTAYGLAAEAGNYAGGKLSDWMKGDHPLVDTLFGDGGADTKADQQRALYDAATPQANGGRTISPGLSLIGERGPEILSMQTGATVIPLDQSMGGNYNSMVFNDGAIHIDAQGGDVDEIADKLLGRLQDKLARR